MSKGNIHKDSLIIALNTAIEVQTEKEKGDFMDSAMLTTWKGCRDHLRNGGELNVINLDRLNNKGK